MIKSKWMRRVLKVAAWGAAGLLVLLLLSPIWLGWVVKPIVNQVVTAKSGTKFHLGEFGLNLYNGKLHLGDLQLFNPPECKTKIAFSLASADVDVDMLSLLTKTLVIESVVVRDAYVSYVKAGERMNFDILLENFQGGAEAAAKAKAEAAANAEATAAKERAAKDEAAAKRQERIAKEQARSQERIRKATEALEAASREHDGEAAARAQAELEAAKCAEMSAAEKVDGDRRKVIIDRLEVSGTLVEWSILTIPVPAITLTGIGRDSGGVSWSGVWAVIYASYMKNLASAGAGLGDLGKSLGNATKLLGDSAGKSSGAAIKSVSEAASSGIDAIKGWFGK